MIITVTPNAAIDKTLTVPNFQVGFRHRASESLTLPGGKGVNIARALKTLGQPVIVSGLVGGRAGQQIVEGLGRENILNDFVRIAGESRTSTAVIDPTAMSQTEVIEYGPVVTAQELDALLEKIDYLAKGAHYVVLAGSLPRRVPEDFYAQVLQRLRRTHCFAVLDSAGEPLRLGVRGRPHVVTPNVREAEDLVGHEFHDDCRTSSTPPASSARWARRTSSSRCPTAAWRASSTGVARACTTRSIPLLETILQHGGLRRRVPGRVHRLALRQDGRGRVPALRPGRAAPPTRSSTAPACSTRRRSTVSSRPRP